MSSFHPGVTGRAAGHELEPLAVSPRQACRLLNLGTTRLYELIAAGELESYRDGRARRITMQSIRSRVARLVSAANPGSSTAKVAPQLRRRGRPRKNQDAAVAS